MASKIVIAKPPNYDQIVAVFPAVATFTGVIYSWGDLIYNPDNTQVDPWLRAHERVHADKQKLMGIEPWWDQYLRDTDFRLAEEIRAHHTEFKQYCIRVGGVRLRERQLQSIAERLCGPLYNGMLTPLEARRAVRLGKTS